MWYTADVNISKIIRDTLSANHPAIVTARMPGEPQPRTPLRALGPDHQHHSDGWEKLGALALRMGGVGIPVYGTKDQYSSKYVQAVVVPNDRLQDVIVHVYLDRVKALGGQHCYHSVSPFVLLKI